MKLLSDAYQSQMQVASVKPNTVCMDEEKSGSRHYKKDDLLYCWTSSSDISGQDTALSEQGRGAAWLHGMGAVCYV